MTVLPLVYAPDPRLKQVSAAVETVDDGIRTLIDNMFATMYDAGGIGLAAVQVGVHKRVLVADVEQDERSVPAKPLAFINPEIVTPSAEINVYKEGCLSFPGQYADVERPKSLRVRFLDTQGVQQEMELTGLLATCVQHEIDHLNGIVFVDHISRLKRDTILRKMEKWKKQDHHHDHHGHHHHDGECCHEEH